MDEGEKEVHCTYYLRKKNYKPKKISLSPDTEFTKNSISCEELKRYFNFHCDEQAIIHFLDFYQQIQNINEGMSADYISDATVDILFTLLKESAITMELHHNFKQKYGYIEFRLFEKIFNSVKNLMKNLDVDDFLNEISNNNVNYFDGGRILPNLYKSNDSIRKVITELTNNDVNDYKVVKNFSMLYPSTKKSRKIKKEEVKKNNHNVKIDANLDFTKGQKRVLKFLMQFKLKSHLSIDVYKRIINILQNVKNQSELESTLFDMLDCQHLDFIEYINVNKDKINKLISPDPLMKVKGPKPAFVAQVTVQSKKEKDLLKQMRKMNKKVNAPPEDTNKLKQDYVKERNTPIFRTTVHRDEDYPNVYDACAGSAVTYGPCVLPASTKHKNLEKYTEITIPSPEKVSAMKEELIPVSSLDEIGQMVFQGMEYFNTIQSKVFPVVYQTNENMLICAPTGAGKTNVALLAITRQINQAYKNGIIQRDGFKIVYVSPMKALASEITSNFSKKLKPLGLVVRELTGDMQLTKREIKETQVIITTPEKWDVISRKGSNDDGISQFLKVLILDEVHLLYSNRGSVIEALVARTIRQVESTQSMIRIIGLSATLPSYIDVAKFLNVNPYIGLFFFDGRFRPVPLTQVFIGVKAIKQIHIANEMDKICYEKVVEFARNGHQVMIFVHARPMTVRTASIMLEMARDNGEVNLFEPLANDPKTMKARKDIANSPNPVLRELVNNGFGIHHAGLIRTDRNCIETYFREGIIRVLVTTSTLAWGVNLPAHAVIIKGTDIYDSSRSSFVDLSILDVLQIFGRAGRPQFDSSGTGIIITSQEKINFYLQLLNNQTAVESSFLEDLADHLNAEVALGTVTNLEEGIQWLSYTFLFQRLHKNPLGYGLTPADAVKDGLLYNTRRKFIDVSALQLDKAKMIRYNIADETFLITDLGRIASHYYVKYNTIIVFNEKIHPHMNEGEVVDLICLSQEFHQLKIRETEVEELTKLEQILPMRVPQFEESGSKKVHILLQVHLCNLYVKNFALMSDMSYIIQNASRIAIALFNIALSKNYSVTSHNCLEISKAIQKKIWGGTPLRQFTVLKPEILDKIERSNMDIYDIREENPNQLNALLRHVRAGAMVKQCAEEFPLLEMESVINPITRSVLRVQLKVIPFFKWNDHVHGKISEEFLLWVQDIGSSEICYHEYFSVTKKNVIYNEPLDLMFTIPLIQEDEHMPHYLIQVESMRWIGSLTTHELPMRELVLPPSYPKHTQLLNLQPLSVTALKDDKFQSLYNFTHFNPIQTQVFFCLYNTDENALIGSPTGSGKTIIAELAVLRLLKNQPTRKVVYIAPLKALVRERVKDWKNKFEQNLKKKVTEITGDVSANARDLMKSDIIITTPEKWDGLSRSWQTRNYVKKVGLIVIDEIHLLGEDRGPVLEVIVSRINFINANTNMKLRVVGLSTAIANANDLGRWLGINEFGLFNFRPSVRPVPIEVHITGFPIKFYCPRMNSMNKPTYRAICTYAPDSPSLVFVSSRRQTRMTALELIAFLQSDINPKRWLRIDDEQMWKIVSKIKDQYLKITLPYGVGIHHAGLIDDDRKLIENLFVKGEILVLVATSTLAWGVNFPAHLVVIKGTEYYDNKRGGYKDMPITDILQMMGRAGRPQFDTSGVAVVFVQDIKKAFYKKFLFEPFPIESNLLQVLPDHVNAELVAGTINCKKDLTQYITWTFFYQRLLQNPMYYNLSSKDPDELKKYLVDLVDATFEKLIDSVCTRYDDEEDIYYPTPMGQIASHYYLSNESMKHFHLELKPTLNLRKLLFTLCNVHEYSEIPVRHSEDDVNKDFIRKCRFSEDLQFDSPHTKVFIILQAHFSRLKMPVSDYYTDLKSVLEQSIRIMEAMIEISAQNKWLSCTVLIQQLMQMVIQGCWLDNSPLITLLDVDSETQELLMMRWRNSEILSQYPEHSLIEIKNAFNQNNHEFLSVISTQYLPRTSLKTIMESIPEIRIILQLHTENEEKIIVNLHEKFNVLSMKVGKEYNLILRFTRIGKKSIVLNHKYPKPVDEVWYINIGDKLTSTLISFSRVIISENKATFKTNFKAPVRAGDYTWTLFLVSNSYLGLDQQYDINFKVEN